MVSDSLGKDYYTIINYTKLIVWRISRLRHKEHRARRSLVTSLSWGDGAGSSRRPGCLEFAGHSTTEKKATKTETSGDVLEFPKPSAEQLVCVRKLSENHLKGSEGIIPKAHIGWERLLLFPLIRVENLTINGTSGRVFRRVFPQ